MQMQQTHHTDNTLGANVADLLALLEGEPPAQVKVKETGSTVTIQEQGIQTLLELIRRRHSLHLRFSGGKDSTTCAVLFIEAVRRAVAEGINTTHHISSSSTGIENPAVEMHLFAVQDELRKHFAEHSLPIEVHLTHPSLASSFTVTTIGRGTLPRFPENSSARQCAADWKYEPAQRLAAELEARAIEQTGREIISVIGTRFDESKARKVRMERRGESSVDPVRGESGELVISIIALWTLNDVWDTLQLLLEPENSPYLSAISVESAHRLFAIYQDSNDGVCGVVLGDADNRAACGSRTGCAWCTVTGENDKSMESMLVLEKYAFMRPLNDFRNLLMATQFDLDTRELLGRRLSPAGYLKIRPDVYSFAFRQDMLRYLLSMDANERDRAEQTEAAILTGRLPDTKENRLMSNPTFELVSLQQLVLIDFHWSNHYAAQSAFPALQIWYDVNVLGRRYAVPKLEKAPKISIPTTRWLKVGNYDHKAPSEGMRSFGNELWNRHRHPDRLFTHREVAGKPVTWFDETEQLTVNAERACEFITCTYPTMAVECNLMPASESASFWLNESIVRLPAGHAHRYQEIALRNRYIANFAERFNLGPADLNSYFMRASITNAEHQKLIPPDQQGALFDDLEMAA